MQFSVRTVYTKEDTEGFYRAFLSGRKLANTSEKVVKIILTCTAILFWVLAAVILVAQLAAGNIWAIPSTLPLPAIFSAIGFFVYSKGRTRFKSKSSWKAYPHKGEQLIWHFDDGGFTLEQKHSSTRFAYAGIIRIYEDPERFYLFDSPRSAHILPKRDFEQTDVAAFGDFISASTGLPTEREQ